MISPSHLLIIGIILLVFGPRRLPELGMTLGKAMKNFKDAMSGVQDATFRNVNDQPERQLAATETPVDPEPVVAPEDEYPAHKDDPVQADGTSSTETVADASDEGTWTESVHVPGEKPKKDGQS